LYAANNVLGVPPNLVRVAVDDIGFSQWWVSSGKRSIDFEMVSPKSYRSFIVKSMSVEADASMLCDAKPVLGILPDITRPGAKPALAYTRLTRKYRGDLGDPRLQLSLGIGVRCCEIRTSSSRVT